MNNLLSYDWHVHCPLQPKAKKAAAAGAAAAAAGKK
jgi:hypothetical protein